MQADKEGLQAELRLARLEARRIQREATDFLLLGRRLESKHAALCLKRNAAPTHASQVAAPESRRVVGFSAAMWDEPPSGHGLCRLR